MLRENHKVPMWQFILFFLITAISNVLLYMPQLVAGRVGPAGWLTAIMAFPLFLLLSFVLNGLLNRNERENLSDVYIKTLGKIAGKAVLCIYLLLSIFLIANYLRFFCERVFSMVGSRVILPPIVLVLVALLQYVSRRPIGHTVRLSYIMALILGPFFAILLLLNFGQVDLLNAMPIRPKDAGPLFSSAVLLFGGWSHFTVLFLFRRTAIQRSSIWKTGLQVSAISALMFTVFFFLLIGSLSADLCALLPVPVFTVVKMLDIPGLIERFDMMLYIWWIVIDFFQIAFFFFASKTLMRDIFELETTESLMTPLSLIAFIGALFITNNRPEIKNFAVDYVVYAELALFFVIPVIAFVVGKLRKKI